MGTLCEHPAARADRCSEEVTIETPQPDHVTVLDTVFGTAIVGVVQQKVISITFQDSLDNETLSTQRETMSRQNHPENRTAVSALLDRVHHLLNNPHLVTQDVEDIITLHGTAFQQRVFKELLCIKPGSRHTYTDLTLRLGLRTTSTRAVATACGSNPIAILVPCHRIIRSDGSLAGYRWGLGRKRDILQREDDMMVWKG